MAGNFLLPPKVKEIIINVFANMLHMSRTRFHDRKMQKPKVPEIRVRMLISSFRTSFYPHKVDEIIINVFCEIHERKKSMVTLLNHLNHSGLSHLGSVWDGQVI